MLKQNIAWSEVFKPMVKAEKNKVGFCFRILVLFVGLSRLRKYRGLMAIYLTRKAFYFRLWIFTLGVFIPNQERSYREFFVLPKNKWL